MLNILVILLEVCVCVCVLKELLRVALKGLFATSSKNMLSLLNWALISSGAAAFQNMVLTLPLKPVPLKTPCLASHWIATPCSGHP